MTANDSGHLNNLDRTQTEALKTCWISLIDAISNEAALPIDQIFDSPQGDELFSSIGYDNPDFFILRWIRARKWDVNAAVQQLMGTLKWRCEWYIDVLLAKGENELVQEEINTGKTYLMGHDKVGRPIIYVHVRDHINDQFSREATEKLGILLIETARKFLKGPIETGTVIIDMSGFGMKNLDYQLVRFFINLLQNYYPETLGLVLVINAPLIFHSCWIIIKRWLDPVVESKIHFLKHESDLTTYIDLSNLPKRLNGTHSDFTYIPPTAEDNDMLAAFRDDNQGRKLARSAHQKAARYYLNVTSKWARGDESETLLKERKEATKQLRDTYEQFLPYVNTRTHYHRTGDINEPIFDSVYERLRIKNEGNIVRL